MNFTSIQNLANFLLEISSDESKYLSYFQWKQQFISMNNEYENHLYDLCYKLATNSNDLNKPSIESTDNWWYEKSNCISGNPIVNKLIS